MFPLTITITNTDQLLRVMSALSLIETAHAVTTGVSANEKAAVLRVAPEQLDRLLHPYIPDNVKKAAKVLAKGTNASPGAASGIVVFEANDAVIQAEKGRALRSTRDAAMA